MSFLNSLPTLTSYLLTDFTAGPEFSFSEQRQELLAQYGHVLVELHDVGLQHRKAVCSVPLAVLDQYFPGQVDRVQPDSRVLSFTVPSLEHVDDIESLALQYLLKQVHGLYRTYNAHYNCLPLHFSTGQGVLLYRGLQLLGLDDAALGLRSRLLQELVANALTSYDVQRIWWAFQYTDEWSYWLDALLRNLAYFKTLNALHDGGFIELFIETEMLRLSHEKCTEIEAIYRAYKEIFEKAPEKKRGYANKVKAGYKWAQAVVHWETRDLRRTQRVFKRFSID